MIMLNKLRIHVAARKSNKKILRRGYTMDYSTTINQLAIGEDVELAQGSEENLSRDEEETLALFRASSSIRKDRPGPSSTLPRIHNRTNKYQSSSTDKVIIVRHGRCESSDGAGCIELPSTVEGVSCPTSPVENVPSTANELALPNTAIKHEHEQLLQETGNVSLTVDESNNCTDDSTPNGLETSTHLPNKKDLLLLELSETEGTYVEMLSHIVDGYMMAPNTQVPMPADLEERVTIIWGNVQQIYEWHSNTFCPEIQYACTKEPNKLPHLFIKYERRFQMYFKYCQNFPKAEFIVSEHIDKYFEEVRIALGFKKRVTDLLIEPVQRLMRYKLLLSDIIKQARKLGEDITALTKAVEIMTQVPKRANDMMNLGRLEGYDDSRFGKITAQGQLFIQESVLVSTRIMPISISLNSGNQKGKQRSTSNLSQVSSPTTFPGSMSDDPGDREKRQVFLFEQCILIAEVQERKNSFVGPRFLFRNFIKVNTMEKVLQSSENSCLLEVHCKINPKEREAFEFLFSTIEAADVWFSKIKYIIDLKTNFMFALSAPIEFQKKQQGAALGF